MGVRIIASSQCAPRGQLVQVWHLRIFADDIFIALVFFHHNDHVLEYGYLRLVTRACNLGMGIRAKGCDQQNQKAAEVFIGSHCSKGFKKDHERLPDPSRMPEYLDAS